MEDPLFLSDPKCLYSPLPPPLSIIREEEYVPFFGPDLMPARQIFGNKRRRRGTRNRYTYVPVYVSENDSRIEDENRRAHAGWKSHAEKNIIEAFEAIFRADARKPISSALFVSPPPRFIKPRGEGFGNTPDINATAV